MYLVRSLKYECYIVHESNVPPRALRKLNVHRYKEAKIYDFVLISELFVDHINQELSFETYFYSITDIGK